MTFSLNVSVSNGRFYHDVARTRKVWTVCDAGGFPAQRNSRGVLPQPFSSARSRVDRIIETVPAYRGFTR